MLYEVITNINQTWLHTGSYDRPLIIGEFHFNAQDHGQVAPGLCPVSVITSYSIHYTKLYDNEMKDTSIEYVSDDNLVLMLSNYLCFKSKTDRITSYNVCYTKLLRISAYCFAVRD